MSLTKCNTFICDMCGKFCRPYDEETLFGCSSYDPPEPLDPLHYCKSCSQKLQKEWEKRFASGERYCGSWQKSKAEENAAKKYNLVWVDSNGIGMLGTKDFAEPYQYIPKSEYDKLSKLPYYGYCKKCGSENKGGYCSDKKCPNSFERKCPN